MIELYNPFTPTFGSVPLQLAGRDKTINKIIRGLNNAPGDPNRATIFVGARGTGKTVLLTKISEEASANGWISANVNADKGMLDEILIQIRDNADHILSNETISHITSVSLGGISITRDVNVSTVKKSWRSDMTSVISELNEKKTGLLLTVDETDVKNDELRTLVVTFQHFVRENRDVALIMAGLPQKVSSLLRDDAISFLRRAFQHYLNPIEENDVRISIKKTVELAGRTIEKDALDLAVSGAKGFPFLIQLIGYHMWEQNTKRKRIIKDDAIEGISLAQNDFEKMVFNTTYRELSDKDIEFLAAMLADADYSTISDVSKRMGVSLKYASVYRKRLIEQGIIGSAGHGKIAFELPMFREFLERMCF